MLDMFTSVVIASIYKQLLDVILSPILTLIFPKISYISELLLIHHLNMSLEIKFRGARSGDRGCHSTMLQCPIQVLSNYTTNHLSKHSYPNVKGLYPVVTILEMDLLRSKLRS